MNKKTWTAFNQEDRRTANKHTKRRSTPLIIREHVIENHNGVSQHTLRMAKWKTATTSNADKDTENADHSYAAARSVNWNGHSRKQLGSFLQN